VDYEAWAEAQVRKKPRLVIHNQFLIVLLDISAIVLPWVAAGTFFWLVFVLKDFLFGVTVLATWTTAFLIYAAVRIYVKLENRKNIFYEPL